MRRAGPAAGNGGETALLWRRLLGGSAAPDRGGVPRAALAVSGQQQRAVSSAPNGLVVGLQSMLRRLPMSASSGASVLGQPLQQPPYRSSSSSSSSSPASGVSSGSSRSPLRRRSQRWGGQVQGQQVYERRRQQRRPVAGDDGGGGAVGSAVAAPPAQEGSLSAVLEGSAATTGPILATAPVAGAAAPHPSRRWGDLQQPQQAQEGKQQKQQQHEEQEQGGSQDQRREAIASGKSGGRGRDSDAMKILKKYATIVDVNGYDTDSLSVPAAPQPCPASRYPHPT